LRLKAGTPPLARGRGGLWTTSCLTLFSDLVRPVARGVLGRLDLLPSLTAEDADTHSVRLPARRFMISGSVAPLARFIMAITSALLLVRSRLGLAATFLARPAFFAGLAFLAACASALRAADAGVAFDESIAFSLIGFSRPGCGRHSHHSGWEKHQAESQVIRRIKGNWRARSLF